MPILGVIDSSKLKTAAGTFDSIQTVTVGSGGASVITFSSIPATYNHLQLRYASQALFSNYNFLRFNSDNGSNYTSHFLFGDGTAPLASNSVSSTSMFAGRLFGALTDFYGVGVIDILDYANTNKFKTARILTTDENNGAGLVGLTDGLWNSTAAINSIEFRPQAGGNFTQYTTFALYGIKGA